MLNQIAKKCKWIFAMMLVTACYSSKCQLIADFSSTPASGCAPLLVRFTDLSTGNPSEWKWDLGNGTISFLQNPAVTYFSPGQYDVKLIIKNYLGSDSVIKTQNITIYASPLVNFAANIKTGCFPLPVQFTDLSQPGSGTISTREWDFGDGAISGLQNPQHTYTAVGNYNVSLRITNSFGCVKTISSPQYIKINTGVKANFTNSTPNSCNPPVTINFSNTSVGTGILTSRWDFGDGTKSILTNPSHTYTTKGSYTVKLIVTNTTGCSDTFTRPNAITLGNVKADFSVPAKVCEGSVINLVNTSAPVPASSKWFFGDGTTSDSLKPLKIYDAAGNYTIKMIANFGACIDSLLKPVSVIAKPVIDFNSVKPNFCRAPFTVNFTSLVSGAVGYTWDFGDGTSSTSQNPSHIYVNKGTYTVKLIAANANGCSDTLVKADFVNIQSTVVTIPGLPAKNCGPFTFNFKPEITSTDAIVSYQWNFGDGTTSTLQNPSHTFAASRSYTISLVTTTAGGCTDTATFVNGIRAGTKPIANFSATPRDVCAYIPVNFTDLSTGNADQWVWYFGDGVQSTKQNPSHQYQDTGLFDVTLIALNNGCPDTIKFTKYIHISPPIASFIMSYDCALPKQRIFTDKSKGADKYEWTFGDGTTSSLPSPVHIYATTGSYLVKLKVTNFKTGCEHTTSLQVPIIMEKADFTTSVNEVCKGVRLDFQTQNVNIANISSYVWDFGDGIKLTSPTNKTSHRYYIPGKYDVTLTITDKLGCKDTLKKPVAIAVNGPTASFKSTVAGICLNSSIVLADSSYTDGNNPIQQWIWKYGDGKSDIYSAPPFQHTYATPGVYSLSLKVIDSKGCADSFTRVNSLVVSHPVATFSSVDTFKCPGIPIKFLNNSTGPKLTYLWQFGDGTTSTDINPIHQYVKVGMYNVTLSIIDQYGCTDKISKQSFIKIVEPLANFLMSDSVTNCPPLVVTFTNTSTNVVGALLWNFGDGTTSALNNPAHFYSDPGIYNVVLTINGPGGCTDTKTKQIKIKGPQGSFTYQNIIGCDPLKTDFIATTQNNSSFIWDFNDGTSVETPASVISHTYSNQGFYLPKMILVDVDGCQVPIKGIDTIKVYGVKADLKSYATVLCDSGSVRFQDSSISNDVITSYQWNFGDGSNSVVKDPIHIYKKTGLYNINLLVTTRLGCRDSFFTVSPVKVISSPQINILGGEGICVPATFNLTANILVADTSALTWQWDLGNGKVSTLQKPLAQNYSTAGNTMVKVIATNSSGCKDTATKTLQIYPLPQIVANADTFFCKGKTVNLSVKGANEYTWTPSAGLSCITCANPMANPESSTQYIVKGTSVNGCINSDTVLVKVQSPFALTAARGEDLCAGSTVELRADGADTYLWTPSTGLSDARSNHPLATPQITTNYRVVGSDYKGCFKDTAYVPLTVYPIPVVDAGEDKTINVGQTIDLIPTISDDVTGVNWSPTAGVFRNSYPGIAVRPVESTEYTVDVTNAGGCRARDKVTIYVICNSANIFMPNTFSPNGDGANDMLYPRGSGVFTIKMFRIFNRWGQVLFEKGNITANNITNGWDGTFKGEKLPPDIFVYTLDIVCENSAVVTFKGNVALIK